MRKLIYIIVAFGSLIANISAFSQSNTFDFIDFFKDITFIKVLTPLGNQPNPNSQVVFNNTWTSDDVESSKQADLYTGGLFRLNTSGAMTEKNNYLTKYSANCIAMNTDIFFLGTNEGIVVSTDAGDSWLEQANDDIDNLENNIINALLWTSTHFFACTNNGIYISTDNGANWTQKLSNKNISSIIIDNNDAIFVGVTNNSQGIYKSTDYGNNWNITGLSLSTYCLEYLPSENILYAGTLNNGLCKTTDGGVNWSQKLYYYPWEVNTIYIDGDDIYIGTDDECRLSQNGSDFEIINNGFPADIDINDLEYYNGYLYAATKNGLYRTGLASIYWNEMDVKDDFFGSQLIKETLINNLLKTDNKLFIVSSGNKIWQSAEVIYNYPYPLNPGNFPNFQCHSFAWHITEGGNALSLQSPNALHYIPPSTANQWEKENWDYIKTVWDDPLWEKVTYDYEHSGIRSLKNNNVQNEDDLIIESKWNRHGPLVEHKLKENPYYSNNATIRYWKSIKTIQGTINYDPQNNPIMIGREISTSGNTLITSTANVEMCVAPMKRHKIHLKDGFHAEAGSKFHAYVKTRYFDDSEHTEKPCKIPWEEESSKNSFNEFLLANEQLEHNKPGTPIDRNNIEYIDTLPCAGDEPPFKYSGKGSGTKDDPYQITTLRQLSEINKDYYGDHYWALMNDIDASETRWWDPYINPNTGDTTYFGFPTILGVFVREIDGRGHIIKNIYKGGGGPLFGYANCMTLKRIGFVNLIFRIPAAIRFIYIGSDERDVTIEECFFDVTLINPDSRNSRISARAFSNSMSTSNITIKNTYVNWNVNWEKHKDNIRMFYPFIINDPRIKTLSIENCYVTGMNSDSLSFVGPPFGHKDEVISCFWNADSITVSDTLGFGLGLGLSTGDLMKRHTFESAGWDFDNIWYINEGMDYPRLQVFRTSSAVEEIHDNILRISPNPADDYIEIKWGKKQMPFADIHVYNVLGQCVLTCSPAFSADKVLLDVSGLSEGVYFVRLGTIMMKFLKI